MSWKIERDAILRAWKKPLSCSQQANNSFVRRVGRPVGVRFTSRGGYLLPTEYMTYLDAKPRIARRVYRGSQNGNFVVRVEDRFKRLMPDAVKTIQQLAAHSAI